LKDTVFKPIRELSHSDSALAAEETDAAPLDDGFKSRLLQLKFSSYGIAPVTTAFLEDLDR